MGEEGAPAREPGRGAPGAGSGPGRADRCAALGRAPSAAEDVAPTTGLT